MQQETSEGFRLSPQQKRLWSLERGDSTPYRVQCAVLIEGDVDDSSLKVGLEQAVRQHESLRTTFSCPPGLTLPVQVIRSEGLRWNNGTDLRALDAQEQRAKIEELFAEALRVPFDFERGPLLDASLFYLSSTKKMLLLGLASLCADKTGLQNLIREVAHAYGADFKPDEAMNGEPMQYADVCEYLNKILEEEDTEAGGEYWHRQVIDGKTNVRLAFENPSPDVAVFKPRTIRREISAPLFACLEERAREYQCAPSFFLLACWQVLLWRLSGQPELVVGASFSGRNFAELESLPGLFERYLPVISHLESSLRFRELLEQNLELSAQHVEWQDHFSCQHIWPTGDHKIAPPFFSICFDGDDRPRVFASGGLTFSIVKQYSCLERFGIKLAYSFLQDALGVEFHYDSQRFEETDIEMLAEQFQTLLEDAVGQPESELGRLRILSNESRGRLLYEFNETTVDYSIDQHLHQRVEEQAERAPNNPAVIFGQQQLTYAELNARANQLAHQMREHGVGPEVLVAVCMERAPELIVGVLGVLKTGGAFVPLDPASPVERLAYILEDTQAAVLLTQERLRAKFPRLRASIICLDTEQWMSAGGSVENIPGTVSSDSIAYVIYTSGSTGQPKGVMVPHRGLSNYLSWCRAAYRLTEGCGSPLHSSIGFDLSLTSLLSPLISGKSVVLCGDEETGSSLSEALRRDCDFSMVKLTPSHLEMLNDLKQGDEIRGAGRVLVIGGEQLFAKQLSFWRTHAPETRIINEYGPTEATVGCCVYEIERGTSVGQAVPIGRPIANTQIYILDERFEPVPVNVTGELYIGGDCLARGYLNQPELTAEKFVPNPFSGKPGARLYRTGDLAQHRVDGNITLRGRIDDQVKIHGYRVELGEVEAVLRRHVDLCEAVVVLREETSERRLVAYVVANEGIAINVSKLRAYLEQTLPHYMIPALFVQLENLPLTPNGKIDRKALPAPDTSRAAIESAYVAPRTPVEERLAKWWEKALLIERVGIHDNFFELGGDSILSIQIANQASEAGIQLTPRQMYRHRTIAELAAVLEIAPAIEVEQGLVTGQAPLTPIQHWFFEQQLAEPHHWNQATLFEASCEVKPEILEKALQHVVLHHDALRSRFVQTASGWQQVVTPPCNTRLLTEVSFAKLAEGERQSALEDFVSGFQASLNLSEGALFRAALIEPGAGLKSRLLIVIHHLVMDIVSWGILLKSLEQAYRQLNDGETVKLAPKTTSYKKWAEGLVEYARSSKLRRELPYWLAETPRNANAIPLDFPSGANTEASMRTLWVSLDAEETKKLLQDVPRAYHTMINDVLLTALVQAFARWTRSRALRVDLENHGREEILEGVDLSRTVGWFTCIFPLHLDLGEAHAPDAQLKTIKEQIRRTPNGGIGYGVLRYLSDEAEIKARFKACPQAQISFNYQGRSLRPDDGAALWTPIKGALGPTHSGRANRRYLLEVAGGLTRYGQLKMAWLYSENLHRPSTIQFFADGFIESLKIIIEHCPSSPAANHTPSDFLATSLSQRELDHLTAAYGELED